MTPFLHHERYGSRARRGRSDTLLGVASVAALTLLLAWAVTAGPIFVAAALGVAAAFLVAVAAGALRDKVPRDR